MLKKILATVGFLMLSFALLIAMQPSEFKITRSLEINAPAEKYSTKLTFLKIGTPGLLGQNLTQKLQ